MQQILKLALILGSVASVSAHPRFARPRTIAIRQAPAAPAPAATSVAPAASAPAPAASAVPAASSAAQPAGPASGNVGMGNLTDVDILQFALTLEHLEATFYQQGFSMFPDSDFTAAGLTQSQVDALKTVGGTEATHVTQLSMAISAAGSQPVQQCTYNFGFTTAQGMLSTARVLEAAGIAAYLGAAPMVKTAPVLSAAAEIVTVEARHQTFIRTASNAVPVPNAFDSPLGPRAVFTLAGPFIQSCPTGSNLNIQAFPSIALQGGGTGITGGQSLVLADPNQPAGATNCAFVDQGQAMFSEITSGSCQVPQGMSGEVFMMVTNSQSIADTAILAG